MARRSTAAELAASAERNARIMAEKDGKKAAKAARIAKRRARAAAEREERKRGQGG
jgi:hypothetical protein